MRISRKFHGLFNTLNGVSKNLKSIFGTLLMATMLFTSCAKNDDADPVIIPDIPSAQEFTALKEEALNNLTQEFQFNAEDGLTTLTSANGVEIHINGNCLSLNGSGVTGTVDVEFVELFNRGNMLITNKTSMGVLPNGDKALLISGGEFYINATQNGQQLDNGCGLQLRIPTNLTGGDDNDMILWTGNIDEDGNIAWREKNGDNGAGGEIFTEGGQYYAFFQSFGWTNIDRFYSDPRPKTTIQAAVPEGYNNTNSSVYLSYDGEPNGLANLDTYDPNTGLFSEHYGQIPIGLECHVIFATEEDGNWRYAIKAVTIAANDIISFTYEETSVATEAQLAQIINALP